MCICVITVSYILGYSEDVTVNIGLSKVSKQLSIDELPKILVLQIKRFFLGRNVSKYTAVISFPLVLDMAPYCTNTCLQVIFHPYNIHIRYYDYSIVMVSLELFI